MILQRLADIAALFRPTRNSPAPIKKVYRRVMRLSGNGASQIRECALLPHERPVCWHLDIALNKLLRLFAKGR